MRNRLLILLALLFSLAGFAFVSAWTGPTASPPGNNTSAPINVGSTNQVKNANLGVNGLAVFGNTILQASSYLNFGSTAGSSGYGFRDNGGTMQYANSGGSWTSFSSGGSSQWTTNGSAIYYNSGNVGIGQTNPGSGRLQVDTGSSGSIWAALFNYNAGSPGGAYGIWTYGSTYALYAQGNVYASAFIYNSDERLKKNIASLTGNLDAVMQLQPVSYNWIDPSMGTTTQIGFIAQAVQKVEPELVYTNASTTLEGIDYVRMMPLVVGSVQELDQKLEAQQTEIDAQQQEINTLEQEVQTLQSK